MITLLLAIIYLAFISLGLPDSLLGSAWPVIHEELNIPISGAGIIIVLISGGTIISSLFSDKLEKKFKTTFVVSFSVLLTAIAMFGFSISTSFWMLCLFAVPYGLGAGAIDACLNNYVAAHYSSKHMAWLHAFWGIGAIISPYIMSYALTKETWEFGYRTVSFIQLGIAVIMFASTPLWFKIKKENYSETSELELLTFKQKFKIKGIFFVLIGFFGYCSLEATAMTWASSYMVQAKEIQKNIAAALASLFFIGITASRIISGFVSNKIGDKNMIRIGTFVVLFGVILLAIPTKIPYFTYAGFIVIGFGCGPIYPCIIHSTPTNFGASKSGAVIGLQMASAYVGSTFMSPLFGLVAQYISIKLLPLYLFFFLIVLLVMMELLNKTIKKKMIEEASTEENAIINEEV